MSRFIRGAGLHPTPPQRLGAANPPPADTRGPYEPSVVFDEFVGRWIITVTGLNDCTLVSASSDATGSWGGAYVSCQQGGPCLNFDPALHIGYDKNGVYYCGAHLGEGNPNTIEGVAYDCFAVPEAEVEGIAPGAAPTHINRVHNMPLDIIPILYHNRGKA